MNFEELMALAKEQYNLGMEHGFDLAGIIVGALPYELFADGGKTKVVHALREANRQNQK
jgi:hypothetical protein